MSMIVDRLSVVAWAAAILAGVSQAALADEPRKFKMGQPGVAAVARTGIEDSCASGPAPKVTITASPRNGTVSLEPYSSVFESGDCKGNKVQATIVVYRPKPGFRGTDSLTYSFEFDTWVQGVGRTSVAKTVDLVVE